MDTAVSGNQDALLVAAQAKVGIPKPSHGHVVLQSELLLKEATIMLSNYCQADSMVPGCTKQSIHMLTRVL